MRKLLSQWVDGVRFRAPADSEIDDGLHRRKLLVLGCFACAAITAGLAGSRLFLDGLGPVTLVLATVSACYAAAPLTQWVTRSITVLAWLFPTLGALGIAAMAMAEGGLFSEALYWLPFTPMVAVLTRGLRGALVVGTLAVVLLATLCAMELSEPPPPPASMVEPGKMVLRTLGVGGRRSSARPWPPSGSWVDASSWRRWGKPGRWPRTPTPPRAGSWPP